MRRYPTLAATVLAGLLAAGCGAGNESADCDLPRQEPLDPASGLHITPIQADSTTYQSDPPTSGPHFSIAAPGGVVGSPLSPAAQVTVLESGRVLLQYDEARRDELEVDAIALANEQVVVAPQTQLDSPIVVTAWTWKMTCSAVDVAAIDRFVAEHATTGFGDQRADPAGSVD